MSFSIYDVNSDGAISAAELRDTILALMAEQDIVMTTEEADKIVAQTMLDLSPQNNDHISFEEYGIVFCFHDFVNLDVVVRYQRFVQKQPEVLSNLTLNISR